MSYPSLQTALQAHGVTATADELAGYLAESVARMEEGALVPAATVRIPRQAGHRFHGKLDSDSTASWTPIPGQAGHLK